MSTVNTATVSLEEYTKLKEFFDNVTKNKIPVYGDGGWTHLYNRMCYVTKDEAILNISKVNEELVNTNRKLNDKITKSKSLIEDLESKNAKLRSKTKWFSFLK